MIVVTKDDGTTEEVGIRELSRSERRRLDRALAEGSRIAEMITGKPKGWADRITPESHVDIMGAYAKSLLSKVFDHE